MSTRSLAVFALVGVDGVVREDVDGRFRGVRGIKHSTDSSGHAVKPSGDSHREVHQIVRADVGVAMIIWSDLLLGGGTLLGYRAIIESTILQSPGAFAAFQMIAEFLMGLGLLVGGLTRLASLGAILVFLNLFLAYFGGNEWIWTYVLLLVSALVVFLTYAGREWGFDRYLVKKRGAPSFSLLW